jgi:hypothetical protein
MSFQLVIPRRVALQQSPPALHQPTGSMQQLYGADRSLFFDRLIR